jgi:hypothetical protein
MAGLATLPPEISAKIYQHYPDSQLGRCVAVLGLSRHLSGIRAPALTSWPLRRILSWKRGEEPVLTPSPETPPETESFRLTIDCRGLLEIERLDERPAYSGRHSDSLVYAFLPDEVDAIDATVHFKVRSLQILSQPKPLRPT